LQNSSVDVADENLSGKTACISA